MADWLVVLRVIVLSLVAALSAVIISVAVWNLSLAEIARLNTAYQVYAIVAGAIALGAMFAIGAAEITFDSAFTGRVWFECSWIFLLFALHIAGSILVTILIFPDMCAMPTFENLLPEWSCTSSKVLLACCWASTGILVLYFFLLVVLCLRRRGEPDIFYCRISRLLPLKRSQASDNVPPQTFTPYNSTQLRQERPQPRTNTASYAHRDGMGPEYEIEHYRPRSAQRSQPHARTHSSPAPSNTLGSHPFSALYPQYLQAHYEEEEQQRLEGIAEAGPSTGSKAQISKRQPTAMETVPIPSSSSRRARPGGPRAPGTSAKS